jgi:hypothetical protein
MVATCADWVKDGVVIATVHRVLTPIILEKELYSELMEVASESIDILGVQWPIQLHNLQCVMH